MESLSKSGLAPVVNLTSVPTEEALAVASLCETVRVKVTDLAPSSGPVEIPVRHVEEPKFEFRKMTVSDIFGFLEGVAPRRKITPREFLALALICEILENE